MKEYNENSKKGGRKCPFATNPTTNGERFVHSMLMWIDPVVHDLIPTAIAEAIDSRDKQIDELRLRIKQLLSTLDYDKMTDYQKQVADLVSQK